MEIGVAGVRGRQWERWRERVVVWKATEKQWGLGTIWDVHDSSVFFFQVSDLRFPAGILFYFQNPPWGDGKET